MLARSRPFLRCYSKKAAPEPLVPGAFEVWESGETYKTYPPESSKLFDHELYTPESRPPLGLELLM